MVRKVSIPSKEAINLHVLFLATNYWQCDMNMKYWWSIVILFWSLALLFILNVSILLAHQNSFSLLSFKFCLFSFLFLPSFPFFLKSLKQQLSLFVFVTQTIPFERNWFFAFGNFLLDLSDFIDHIFDNLSVDIQELFLRMSITNFSVQQFIQDFIKFDSNHLVIHNMSEMRRS